MSTLTIPAHFDGERIQLDEPVDLRANTRLLITVIPSEEEERDFLVTAAGQQNWKTHQQKSEELYLRALQLDNPVPTAHRGAGCRPGPIRSGWRSPLGSAAAAQ